MAQTDNTVLMEGVRLVFRNFTGKEGPYNAEGERGFGVVLPSREVAEAMAGDEWNVKQFKERDDDEEGVEPEFWLPVKLKYRARDGSTVRPPKIVMITSRGRTNLTEENVELLDWADIQNVDLIVRPSPWNVQGKQGIAAYVQSMFVTIEEDALEKKYAELDAQ